jgi:DNA-binding transcriptional ArsR family regulator
VLDRLGALVERIESGRRWQILALLADGPRSGRELARHFRFPLTLGWHLRELRALGLVAHNRRAGRYHLVRPAVEALAEFCNQLDQEPEGPVTPFPGPWASSPSPAGRPATVPPR